MLCAAALSMLLLGEQGGSGSMCGRVNLAKLLVTVLGLTVNMLKGCSKLLFLSNIWNNLVV